MKKKLLKPPDENGEIIFLPSLEEFTSAIKETSRIGTCHQPYFFNPGVSLKFLFLNSLFKGRIFFIFLDIDRVNLNVKIPSEGGHARTLNFIKTEQILDNYPAPEIEIFDKFFSFLEDELGKTVFEDKEIVLSNLSKFRELVFDNTSRKYLKEILVESFLGFYNIETEYVFLSDLVKGEEFKEFFMKIYKDAERFREIFNKTLDEYKNEYRFRYKNYPFPALKAHELPFWIVTDGKRERCFEKIIDESRIRDLKILPRASTLTIFLRLYKLDLFIHGIGGANYEWVQDRIIERFFKQTPPMYATLTGTFLLENSKEREFPYFFFNPQRTKETINQIPTPGVYTPGVGI